MLFENKKKKIVPCPNLTPQSSETQNGDSKFRSTRINKEFLKDVGYKYYYDTYGNITRISEGTRATTASSDIALVGATEKVRYTYDRYSQLTREDNAYSGKSTVFTYDNGGNILSKSEYPYTTGTLGSATSTVNYSYDTAWKDKLVGLNNQAIAYDQIGNPTSYRGYVYDSETDVLRLCEMV